MVLGVLFFVLLVELGKGELSIDQMKGVFPRDYSLDDAIKKFIRSELSYRYLVVADDPAARALEKHGLETAKGQGADLLNSI